MTIQQSIKAILDSNLTEIKDEIKNRIEVDITGIAEANRVKEIFVATRFIPGTASMQFMFFDNEKAAMLYCKHYKDHGVNYQKYTLESTFTPEEAK